MKKIRKILSSFIIISMFSVCVLPSNAVGISEKITEQVSTRAGVETLPYGWYDIGAFTFTDTNLTPVKTISGRYVSFEFGFNKAFTDKGIGPVKLTVQIRDTSGRVLGGSWVYSVPDGYYNYVMTPEIDLGGYGKKVQVWVDASSTGTSNGNFRSIEVFSFCSYVR